jgi:hypothetical protein
MWVRGGGLEEELGSHRVLVMEVEGAVIGWTER